MKNKTILIFTFAILLFSACKKRTIFPTEKDGMVVWTGSSQVDAGCDFMIEINSVQYKPLDLSPEFQQDSLLVKVRYTLKGEKGVCSWNSEAITMKIIDISKR